MNKCLINENFLPMYHLWILPSYLASHVHNKSCNKSSLGVVHYRLNMPSKSTCLTHLNSLESFIHCNIWCLKCPCIVHLKSFCFSSLMVSDGIFKSWVGFSIMVSCIDLRVFLSAIELHTQWIKLLLEFW